VAGGAGANGAGTGQGYGSGIFIQGTQAITFAPGAGQTETISGVVADMSGSGGSGLNAGTGSLTMNGVGTLVLAADNTPGSSSDPDKGGFSGGITIKDGTVDLTAVGAAGSGAITFQNPPIVDPNLEFTPANAPTNAIDGFAAGDDIQIDDFIEHSGTYFNGVLTLHGTDGTGTTPETVTLNVPGLTPSDFSVNVASGTTTIGFGSNETDIVACYCRGTLIETKRGQKKVEKLNIGDEVVTMSGAMRPIKWIGRRSYGGRFIMGRTDILPICIKAGALGVNVPKRDLSISPHHAMYFKDAARDSVLIEAKDLVNGVSIVQADSVDKVEYFHIELETHDVIVAEGALSETFLDDDSRGMFHNAHEYDTLYAETPSEPAHYCAPRCDDGYELETVRRNIARRAGLAVNDSAGALRGHIDAVGESCIKGWAQNVEHPEAPVCLDIYAGGQLLGQMLANQYREDLEQAGLGSGRHSFIFRPPAGVTLSLGAVEVRRSHDGALVESSFGPAASLQSAHQPVQVRVHRRVARG